MARPSIVLAAAAALLAGTAVLAQIEGAGRGVAPVDGGGAFEVSGLTVDVGGKTAEAARLGGWRLAQRKAWVQLSKRLGGGGALLSDATLDQLVSGIVVENEQIGPTRYIARLGVLFDRTRAGAILGIAPDQGRSVPMLVVPLQWSAGVGQVFEARSEWQQAWARFRTGNSSIDYVRPAGTGADPLLLNAGQVSRPGRGWWRRILDQYGAADVLIPAVRLYRQWPGGPVIGVFEARHGPDDTLLGRFTLRVGSAEGIAQLLDVGVARLDGLYQQALRQGRLAPDQALTPPPDPDATPTPEPEAAPVEGESGEVAVSTGTTLTIQYDTPGVSSVANSEALVRAIPGVRSVATTSLALGGVSLMRVVTDGDLAALQAALEARGYQVAVSGTTLRIRRSEPAAPAG
ncbi:hypothetical protein GCM10011380_22730 [Sphingomonas metalli]|uniref:Heavy-metal-associated domain-containing protein n=1 Tax=Sphingomonas metalli TaxID=1779358 RepID=A0A916T5R5_9SPHN|nr:heavy-metal-associated domain-containing protein [Sphingomonas metalli]GGB32757.1 hypothetical protein GCM10011380_22730 [Sphingomonas metalli]